MLVQAGLAGVSAQETAPVPDGPRFLLAVAGRARPVEAEVSSVPLLRRRISLSLQDQSIVDALRAIKAETGIVFVYRTEMPSLSRRVTLRAENITVGAALTDILVDAKVDVLLSGARYVTLVPRGQAPVMANGAIVGRVTDAKTQAPITGATVIVEGTRHSATTGNDGRYRITDVAPGAYTVRARYIGYAPSSASVTVNPDEEATADFGLERSATKLQDVVTVQKREERLINTPQSVSVLSADALAKAGALQFRDFATTVPGLTFTTVGAGYTQLALRGVTTGFDVTPAVGIYVDDVPYGSSSGFAQGAQVTLDVGLFDIDRIEVLRGPQGTLYGASTMGGLLKYVTKRADAARFSVDAQAGSSGTEHGGVSYDGGMAVNAPIVAGKVAVRASGFYSHDGGYIDNLALGQDHVNRSGIYGGRTDLLFTPTSALTIRIGGFLQNISRDGEASANYTLAGAPKDGSLDQRRLFAEPFDQHFRLVSGTIAYDLGPATATSISSYQTTRTDMFFDFSSQFVPIFASIGLPYSAIGFPQGLNTKKFTEEVRLASSGTKPLEWLVGGFYTHEISENTQAFDLRDLAGQPAPNILYTFSSPSRYEEYAAFGDLTYHLTSKFDMSGGIRYAHNRQSFTQIGSGLLIGSAPTRRSSESVVTYLGNARYHFGDHATGYLRFATGYRPGGPNFVANDPTTGLPVAPPTFEADRLQSYEAGVKAETADRTLGFDLAGYYIDWNNIQINAVRGGFGVIANAPGGATVRGAELSLTANPTRDFTLAGAFAYQDAHLSEADPDLGGANGERLPNVPRFTAAVNADYNLPGSSLRPTVGATLRHISDRMAAFDRGPLGQYRLPAYQTVDLRTGITLGPGNALQLYVHNLFDSRGQLAVFNNTGPGRVSILQPRTVGLTATTHF
jgi:iron complex outermembrane receptor protein